MWVCEYALNSESNRLQSLQNFEFFGLRVLNFFFFFWNFPKAILTCFVCDVMLYV